MDQAILSFVLGNVVGFSLGLLGGGGSILTVPLLVYVIGQDVHTATGTSLAIVGISAMIGAIAHARRGRVRIKSGLAFGLTSMIGAIPGVWGNRFLSGRMLLLLFSFLMIAVGINMLRKKGSIPQSERSAVSPEDKPKKKWVRLSVFGLAIGFLTGFFGVGGGFLIVPALLLGVHLPMHQAIGTSLVVITMASVAGFFGQFQFGKMDLPVVAFFALGGAFGALMGTRLAGKVPERPLQTTFGWFIILVAFYIILRH
jgi:uncharacterized membrane protein YfcA